MKNRIELAQHFAELGFHLGAEIGVEQGIFAEKLIQNIPHMTRLYCVDNWGNRDHKKTDPAETARRKASHDECKARLSKYPCALIVEQTSMDAIPIFEDGSLDFVFIDANHEYGHVKDDIREWAKKVRVGGIVSGHDYYVTRAGNTGVIDAVNEYCEENGIELLLTDWDAKNPVEDDRQPCWYFVKK